MSPVYRDGRGQPEGTMTREALAVVKRAGEEGVDRSELVEHLVETFEAVDHRHAQRHVTRMTSGRYRGRLELGEDDAYRWVDG